MGILQVINVFSSEGNRDERKGTGYNQHHPVKVKTCNWMISPNITVFFLLHPTNYAILLRVTPVTMAMVLLRTWTLHYLFLNFWLRPWKAIAWTQHSIAANTHKDISVFKIVPPVWPDLPLSAYVPYVQLEALRLYTFDVKALERAETKPHRA